MSVNGKKFDFGESALMTTRISYYHSQGKLLHIEWSMKGAVVMDSFCPSGCGNNRYLKSLCNCLAANTFHFIGRDVHRVALKELSAVLCCIGDAGAGERAVLDRHRAGRTVAVRGAAFVLIHIDCVVCVAEAIRS